MTTAPTPPAPSPADHPLEPALPYDMRPRAAKAAGDVQLQQFVHRATEAKVSGRLRSCAAAFGPRYDDVRELAGRIKQHTLDHLDTYVERFVDRANASGATVHFAGDGGQANAICAAIARENGCRLCVKSKSMVTEETQLVPALEAIGVETLETDLGEFIIQLDHDAPSHIVMPMIHKNRVSVAQAFQRELGAPYTEDPAELTAIARDYMRQKYRAADLGISGANFLVAETGTVVVCTNEGNADLAVCGPRVHVVFVGIEKLVPRSEDLSVLLKLLARSATGQELTVYTTMITGPRRAHEHDGPDQVHVILLDNGRTDLLRAESRELLRCIRCGACLNSCPVYRKVGGGHAYGAVYSGPIGAVITPIFKGLANYKDLPHASSLCGACYEACPVRIDIPRHLVRLRREMAERGITSARERLLYRAWAAALRSGSLYRLGASLQRALLRRRAGPDGWIDRLPGPLAGWTRQRDFPAPAARSFRAWWREREREDRP
jgi:L-lactate dehydrogenase complex protein LldF